MQGWRGEGGDAGQGHQQGHLRLPGHQGVPGCHWGSQVIQKEGRGFICDKNRLICMGIRLLNQTSAQLINYKTKKILFNSCSI